MKLRAMLMATIALTFGAAAHAAPPPPVAPAPPVASADTRPNFLVIVADDLGWSDLGSFGGEIATPNLDALATGGVRLTGFHTAPTCSPTRAMLMSGVDHHEAGLGSMAELLVPGQIGRPGYEGYLNDRVASIAELLRQGGYRTMMSGKWHLGLTPERGPAARGFEHSYALLQGLSNHFGADQTPEWAAVGGEPTYRDDGRVVTYPKGRFTTDYFTDRLISYLGAASSDSRPFFAYLAYTAPHWPLQAPPEVIAKYKGRYDAGYDVLRDQRLAREKALGLVPQSATPHRFEMARPWAALSPAEKAAEARKMEVYAAMVDRLDQNVGRVVAELKRIGRYDNTVIVFLADNGPEGGVIDSPMQVKTPEQLATLKIDNTTANIGAANSYVGYGPGWAQANSAPSWLIKAYPTEGGIRTTAFVTGAGVSGGRLSNANVSVTDIAPTLLGLANLRQPATFNGHAILPFEGHDLRPLLTGQAASVRNADEAVGYELFYRRALRQGDWKAVYLPRNASFRGREGFGDGQWKLFNLAIDPGETHDLSAEQPDRLKALIGLWDQYAATKGVVVPARDEAVPPAPAGRGD